MLQARVLLADPDEAFLETYGQFLAQEGFEVETASSGLECVSSLREFEPDVLVMEPELLWGQGEDVLAMMRDEFNVPQVPVIIVSRNRAFEHSGQRPQSLIREFLVKPLAPKHLANAIRQLLYARLPERAFAGHHFGLAQGTMY
jgi:DNA-binding response OmpR family regulator